MPRTNPNTNNNNNNRNSRIPWSPGETLASETRLHAPLLLVSPTRVHSPDTLEYSNLERHDEGNNNSTTRLTRQWCCGCCAFCSSVLSFLCCCWCKCLRNCGACCCRRSRQFAGAAAEEEVPQDQDYFHRHHDRRDQQNNNNNNDINRGASRNICWNMLYVLLSLLTFGGLYHFSSRGNQQEWSMNAGESRHVATAGFLTDSVQIVSHMPTSSSSSSSSSPQGNNNDNSTTTITRGIAVYATKSPQCPLLTGPPVVVDGPNQELVLFHNAYQYQYFFLNEGSTMRVTVHQIQGATNILVLRGSKVLARMQNKRSSNHHSHSSSSSSASTRGSSTTTRGYGYGLYSDVDLQFYMDQVVLERFSWAQEGGNIDFSFTSPASDVYVLLYDNAASNQAATLKVHLHMVLTTYNLQGLVPWCSHSSPIPSAPSLSSSSSSSTSSSLSEYDDNNKNDNPMDDSSTPTTTSFTCPPLEASTAGCIIVQAVEHRHHDGDDSDNNDDNDRHHRNSSYYTHSDATTATSLSNDDAGDGDDDDNDYLQLGDAVVQVTVYTTRNWFYIGGLSLLPSLLLAFWSYCRTKQRRGERRERFYAYQQSHRYYHHHPHQFHPPQPQQGHQLNQQQHQGHRNGPNYHYLPPTQLDGSDHFVVEPSSDHEIVASITNNESERTHPQRATEPKNHAQETLRAEHRDQSMMNIHNNNEEAPMIPAENVYLLNEQFDRE